MAQRSVRLRIILALGAAFVMQSTGAGPAQAIEPETVSYTHLTLPTILRV